VLSEPHAEELEGGYDHGVEVPGLERGWPAALVHDVETDGKDRPLPVRRVHSGLYLEPDTQEERLLHSQ
jgi:hypothetical protein